MLLNQKMSAEVFDEWVYEPENLDRYFELINGEAVEVIPHVYTAVIVGQIQFLMMQCVKQNNRADYVLGKGAGYQIGDDRYAPNVSYLSKSRQPILPPTGYIAVLPDLVVEVVSPSDSASRLWIKIRNYLAQGVVVWVVHPNVLEVVVYLPDETTKILTASDTITGGDVLPEFSVKVAEFFNV